MKKFLLNEGIQGEERTIEAEWYQTVGEFVDFFIRDGSVPAPGRQVYRIRAGEVHTIELKS